jgi:hypothetical protein
VVDGVDAGGVELRARERLVDDARRVVVVEDDAGAVGRLVEAAREHHRRRDERDPPGTGSRSHGSRLWLQRHRIGPGARSARAA